MVSQSFLHFNVFFIILTVIFLLTHLIVSSFLNIACTELFESFVVVTGEVVTVPVDSWTGAEELAGRAVRERGIMENSGWTLSLSTGTDNIDISNDGLTKEINGLDYVLDLVAEMELAPAFPACRSSFLQSSGPSRGARRHPNKVSHYIYLLNIHAVNHNAFKHGSLVSFKLETFLK